MDMVSLSDCDQALRRHMFREVLEGITGRRHVQRQAEEVLTLLRSALNAVLFGCAEPRRERQTAEALGAGDRPPVKIADEREPRGTK